MVPLMGALQEKTAWSPIGTSEMALKSKSNATPSPIA
jgi:hypothetical protein